MVNKTTSKPVAKKASQLLRSPNTTPKVKSVAGSALSQKTIAPKLPRSRNRSK